MSTDSKLLVFSGNANPVLAHKICEQLKQPLSQALVTSFSDKETRVEIETSVRGQDVFIIQPTCHPANERLMELFIMLDAMRRSSPQRITVVMPYYGYGRQERKSTSRTPITAKLVADLLVNAGMERMLTVDLHTAAIQGFFNVPVDHLYARPIFLEHIESLKIPHQDLVILSPDAGGIDRARQMAQALGCGLAMIDKRRDKPGGQLQVVHLIGDVAKKTILIIDDICDTANTLVKAAQALTDKGAERVLALITHPVLSGQALQLIEESCLETLLVTNSIPLSPQAHQCQKIRVLDMAPLLATAIRRIHLSQSLSDLF